MTAKKKEESSGSDENVTYLYCGFGPISIYTCQNSSRCTLNTSILKMKAFYCI